MVDECHRKRGMSRSRVPHSAEQGSAHGRNRREQSACRENSVRAEGLFGVCDLRTINIHGKRWDAGYGDCHRSKDRRDDDSNALRDSKEWFFRRVGHGRCGHGSDTTDCNTTDGNVAVKGQAQCFEGSRHRGHKLVSSGDLFASHQRGWAIIAPAD